MDIFVNPASEKLENDSIIIVSIKKKQFRN